MIISIRPLTLVAAVGCLAGLALAVLRISNSVSFAEPLQMVTSGAEWESFFAIWKAIHNQEVYNDRLKPPFSAAVYNWLFYQSYAAFTKISLGALGLSEAWLPTVGRVFTLVAVAVGAAASYLTFQRLFDADRSTRALSLAFAVFAFTGPLVGWWVFTQRSDIWAFVWEAVGVMLFLRFYPHHRLRAVALLALCCYLAWSFKQINVFAVGGVGLLLLARRDWLAAAWLSVLMIAAWALTLWLGGPGYRETLFFTDFTLVFEAATGFRNLANLAIKTGPTLLPFAVLLGLLATDGGFRRATFRSDASLLALLATGICSLLAIPASFQSGAAENYYFSLSFFQTLAVISSLALIVKDHGHRLRLFAGASLAGWCIVTAALGAVFTGAVGVTDQRVEHRRNMQIKACMDRLPRPIYNNLGYMMLPWMAPGNPEPYVVSFNYDAERAAGKPFADNGIGGMVERGFFKSLVLSMPKKPLPAWDGGSMARYELRADLCEAQAVFLRRDISGSVSK